MRTSRSAIATVLAAALTATLLGAIAPVVTPAADDAIAVEGTGDTAAAHASEPSSVLPTDAGVTLPVDVQQAAGDVLGEGYDQLVRIKGTSVEIVDPREPDVPLRAFTVSSLETVPRVEDWRPWFGMETLAKTTGHQVSRIAVAGDSIYVSTMLPPGGLTPMGYWEGRSIVLKYNVEGELQNSRTLTNDRIVTALDAYKYGDKTYLALGLNTTGVRVVDADAQGMHDVRVVHEDWNGRWAAFRDRDMVTAVKLATDDDGRFILLAGKFTDEHPAVVASDLGISTDKNAEKIWENNYRAYGAPWDWPNFFSTGPFGPDGKQMAAISWVKANNVALLDLATGTHWVTSQGGNPALAVKFFTDVQGEPRMAIHRGVAIIAGIDTNGNLFNVAEIPEEEELIEAVPGYRAWSMEIENRAREQVVVSPYRGGSRWNGCWWGDELRTSSNPLPSSRITIPAGSTAGPYGTAQRTYGESCWETNDGTLYLQVASSARPEQAEVIKLLGDNTGLRLDQQVGGGRFTLKIEREGRYGVKLAVTERFDAPSPEGSPTLAATRLTPKPADNYVPSTALDDPTRPVYRFTVSGQKWQVPGADQLSNVTLPSPTAEGSVDGVTWTALGTTTSPLKPSRQGTAITLGDSTFYWQTIPGGPDYRYYRVTLPDGTTSNTIDVVTDTTPPEPDSLVNGFTLPETTSVSVRANGLDQSAVPFRLLDSAQAELDPARHADLYERVYFRDEHSKYLITGLGNPEAPGALVSVTPTAGQFSNAKFAEPAHFSTNLRVYQPPGGTRPPRGLKVMFKANAVNSTAKEMTVRHVAALGSLALQGTAANGLAASGCAEGVCTLVEPLPDTPVLYGLDERTISLHLNSTVVPGTNSLPLVSQTEPTETIDLAKDSLLYDGSKVSLRAAHPFGYNATVTTHVVTHGELLWGDNVFVKAKE